MTTIFTIVNMERKETTETNLKRFDLRTNEALIKIKLKYFCLTEKIKSL